MSKRFQLIGKVDETHSLRVSARAEGLCLSLPKSLCELYGLVAGDKIKAQLKEHFRPAKKEDEES